MQFHPGGASILLKASGADGTQLVRDRNPGEGQGEAGRRGGKSTGRAILIKASGTDGTQLVHARHACVGGEGGGQSCCIFYRRRQSINDPQPRHRFGIPS